MVAPPEIFYMRMRYQHRDFIPIRASIAHCFGNPPSERQANLSHREFLILDLVWKTTKFGGEKFLTRVCKYRLFTLLELKGRLAREIAFFELVVNGLSFVSG
jgi:hypothetical protein